MHSAIVVAALFAFAQAGEIEDFVDYAGKDATRAQDAQCFGELDQGKIIEFVIDLSADPGSDPVDVAACNSPIGEVLNFDGRMSKDVTNIYFETIEFLINEISFGFNPAQTYTVITDSNTKYYIQGQPVKRFDNSKRGDKTLLKPAASNYTGESPFAALYENNLGRATRLALAALDNGIPTALSTTRPRGVQTAFRIVISDGHDGYPLNFLSDTPSITTLIDVGDGRRVCGQLSGTEVLRYANVFDVDHPRTLMLLARPLRYLACKVGVNGDGN